MSPIIINIYIKTLLRLHFLIRNFIGLVKAGLNIKSIPPPGGVVH
jgi:hypothetical protein